MYMYIQSFSSFQEKGRDSNGTAPATAQNLYFHCRVVSQPMHLKCPSKQKGINFKIKKHFKKLTKCWNTKH